MLLRRLLILPIRAYQILLSPLLGQNCRFQPTCSDYAQEAISRHGPVRGIGLAARRLLRCNPFTRLEGGWAYDPVPEKHSHHAGCGHHEEKISGAVE